MTNARLFVLRRRLLSSAAMLLVTFALPFTRASAIEPSFDKRMAEKFGLSQKEAAAIIESALLFDTARYCARALYDDQMRRKIYELVLSLEKVIGDPRAQSLRSYLRGLGDYGDAVRLNLKKGYSNNCGEVIQEFKDFGASFFKIKAGGG
jgi:hypothetical protein